MGKNTKTQKKSHHKEKENRAENSNFKKIDNLVKTINLGKKNVTIGERVKENMKSGKYMNNTQYLILEQEIRKKELEIQEFERKMKEETEIARKNPKEEAKLFESLQNFEEEQRIFVHRIHEKIEKDLDHGKKFRMDFKGQKTSEDFDVMQDKSKKIKNFLKSETVENKPKPKNSDFIDPDVQKRLFDDEFLMKPWKFDQKKF